MLRAQLSCCNGNTFSCNVPVATNESMSGAGNTRKRTKSQRFSIEDWISGILVNLPNFNAEENQRGQSFARRIEASMQSPMRSLDAITLSRRNAIVGNPASITSEPQVARAMARVNIVTGIRHSAMVSAWRMYTNSSHASNASANSDAWQCSPGPSLLGGC